MSKIEYPFGALRTFEEFEKHKPGPYYIVSPSDPYEIDKAILTSTRTAPGNGGIVREYVFSQKRANRWWWSPTNEMFFPTSEQLGGFIFANYWLALAYKLKLDKSKDHR